MAQPFLDTNIILRHILNDEPDQSPACDALIERIEQGSVSVWTTDLAIAEVVWVLSSKRLYNLSRDEIRDALRPLIALPGIRLANKRMYARVLDLYATLPIDYIDAYHAALMERRAEFELFSYDADFDRLPDLMRREP